MGLELCAEAVSPDKRIANSTAHARSPFMVVLPSLRLQSGFLDDLLRGRAILFDEARERIGSAGDGLEAALDEVARAESRLRADARDGVLQAGDNWLRGLGRREQAEV